MSKTFEDLPSQITPEEAQHLVDSVPHWHHRFEIFPGVWTPGTYEPGSLWNGLNIASRCPGARLLDIGASDGFFSKTARDHGAAVVSVDYRAKNQSGFAVMERLSGKPFEYHQLNVYDLRPEVLGEFDIVLLLGVLYHLPDMLRALYLVRQLCRGTVFIETLSHEFGVDLPLATYLKADSGGGDWTNFWSPNRRCMIDMLHDTSFDVVREERSSHRLFIEARPIYNSASGWKMAMGYGSPR